MVDPKDQESNGGNATPNQVETVMFEGHEVLIGKNEKGENIIDPQDAPAEVVEKLNQQATSLLASLNKKNLDAKKELSDLELRKKELELKEREIENRRKELELESSRTNTKPHVKTDDELWLEIFGTDSNEDLQEMSINDPKGYAQKQAKYASLVAVNSQKSQLSAFQQEQALSARIISEGYSPDDVRAIANTWGISDMNKAFDLLKQQQKPRQTVPQNMVGQVQADSAKVLPGGLKTKITDPVQEKEKKLKAKWDSL